jgi:hypothetical protein
VKRIRVHGIAHARAALTAARAAGVPVALLSPAATQAGIGWWRHLAAQATAEFPDARFQAVLDCGPSAGMALAAIRAKAGPLEADVSAEVLERLADIAQQAGTQVTGGGEPALDLLGLEMSDASRACREWLAAEGADRTP